MKRLAGSIRKQRSDTGKYKLNQEQAFEKLNAIAKSHNGKFLSTEWKGTQARYTWSCSGGHIWTTPYRVTINGRWCNKCANRIRSAQHLLEDFVALERLNNACNQLNLELIQPFIWQGGNLKYKFNCKDHGEFETSYISIVQGHGCGKCGTVSAHEKQKLTQEEVKSELILMGLNIGPEFEYIDGYTPIKGVYYKGKPVSRRLYTFRSKFRATGSPVGIPNSSKEDSWIGFICSRISKHSLYLSRPDFMEGLELDVYDPFHKFAIEFNGPYHDKLSTKINNDYRKVELCKENGIKLIVFGWRNYPKDRIKQTIFILDALAEIVQFNRYHLLKEVNENLLDGVFKEWCNNQGLFNGIEHYQNAVKEEILTRGVLTRAEDSSFASRIGNVCNPKGRYFSQEIRDMAISLGYKSIRANKNYANVLVT